MAYIRQRISGTTPQDIKKMNDNIENLWFKTFGDITYDDVNSDMQNKVMTQWLPVQGEGNIDSSHPLYIRFFIPPNVRKIKTSNFNIITSRYRMDSDITNSQPSKVYESATTSSVYPETSRTSSTMNEVTRTSSSASSGVASVGGGGSTSSSGGGATAYIEKWGTPPKLTNAPSTYIGLSTVKPSQMGTYYATTNDTKDTMGVVVTQNNTNTGAITEIVDLHWLQHCHSVPNHYHTLPTHSHNISLQPHSHNITIPSHYHETIFPSHSHTVDVELEIPEHAHNLNEGIKESAEEPKGIVIYINDNRCSDSLYGDNRTQNDIDITENLNIGAWNIIKVVSNNVSRVTIYGTIEMITK